MSSQSVDSLFSFSLSLFDLIIIMPAASKKNVPVSKIPVVSSREDGNADDGDSIHSRHALKVFKNGNSNGSGSAFSSTLTLNNPPVVEYSANMNEQETAEWNKYRNSTLIRAAIKLVLLFIVCSALLYGTLHFALPKIDE